MRPAAHLGPGLGVDEDDVDAAGTCGDGLDVDAIDGVAALCETDDYLAEHC